MKTLPKRVTTPSGPSRTWYLASSSSWDGGAASPPSATYAGSFASTVVRMSVLAPASSVAYARRPPPAAAPGR
ncbi:hypothetical protein ACRAKJ_12335 [Saccharothrix sp. DSM 118769]